MLTDGLIKGKEGVPGSLFERFKENFINFITSRFFVLSLVFCALAAILIFRVFNLQIIEGEKYLNDFLLKTEKNREIASTRGNIYDTNGVLLAYSELAYSVKIEDVFEGSKKTRNINLNDTIYRLIKMIEKNGDRVISDFNIILNEDGEYEYNVSDTQLLRFKADVYGRAYITDLKYEEETATAAEMMADLMSTDFYGIGTYTDPNDSKSFVAGMGYTPKECLQIVTIRYAMGLTSYQKYLGTTVASDVNEKTVAVIMENLDTLDGVSIEEDTARRYVDSVYFAPIIGYTGKISTDELAELNQANNEKYGTETDRYSLNDIVGKTGIEATMELELQGKKGTEQVFVDNMGKVIEVSNRIEPVAGNDIYLTIDHDLQIATYNILEQNIAGILLAKIQNIREYKPSENSSGGDIIIPIYDVYYALFNNNVINISHFENENAGETEIKVYNAFIEYKEKVFNVLSDEIKDKKTPYKNLKTEYQVYESNIVTYLTERGIILSDKIDSNDETYIAWKTEETIGLGEYLEYLISTNCIDVAKLSLTSQYSDSKEVFNALIDYIIQMLDKSGEFNRKLYKYMILNDVISGKDVCKILCEQGIYDIDPDDEERLFAGTMTAYEFMRKRIETLEITPAQLALDPFSGSMVITDVNTGNVLALVSYPSYDNNRMTNTVDSSYYAALQTDKSRPMYNYATQQQTAPGSIFKMVTAAAGLQEGVVTPSTQVLCAGIFDKANYNSKCWIYPRSHGMQKITDAIQNSCNHYFYEVGYRLSLDENLNYNSELGVETIYKYAEQFGLADKSGVEIDEAEPQVSDELPVFTAIGQGTNNFTTVGLARYVTTIANGGTCYDLTLLDKRTDHNQTLLEDYEAEIHNTVEMPSAYWDVIHTGMRRVVQSKSYYNDLGVTVAGKTGTAQESKNRTNHAVFVCYAPYEEPEIAIATRIAFGYSSDYAARTTREVLKYYYNLENEDELVSGTADTIESGIATNEW